jgi:predicted transcriptional regulator
MPRRKAEEMSPAEWKVMTIVWRLKECAIGEVLVETRDDPGWARSTVKTLLRRLIDKGFINAKRVGSSFLYRPAQSPLQSFRRVVDTVLDNALEGTSGPILEYMIKKSDLTVAEMRQLQSLLDEYAAKKEKQK